MKMNSFNFVWIGIVVCLLTITIGVSSAAEVNVEQVGHFGGFIGDAVVVGNHTYFAQGQDLVVLDTSDPSDPSEIGRLMTPSAVRDLALSGSYIYVADAESGLLIVDIKNPSSPIIKGSYNTDTSAVGVDISGNYAYVADNSNYLYILDISNPSSPTRASIYMTPGYAIDVAVSGNYAYIADGGLVILNITKPSAPKLVKRYDYHTNRIVVSENYVYIAGGRGYDFTIVDVSNPYSATIVGSFLCNHDAKDVAVSGDYAYLSIGYYDSGTTPCGLAIVNVSNPSAPVLVGGCSVGTTVQMGNIVVSENHAYLSLPEVGLIIFDITDPSVTTISGSYNTIGNVNKITASGNYAYITTTTTQNDNHLFILDIKDPAAPKLIGQYNTTTYLDDIAISDNYAYVCDYNTGLLILDISAPSAPTFVSIYYTGVTNDVVVSGNYAYVGTNTGLVILDITDPSAPQFVSNYPAGSDSLVVLGNYAYGTSDSGLSILNITDPLAPKYMSNFGTPGYAHGLAISGNYAYVTYHVPWETEDSLEIVDISNPSSPKSVAIYRYVELDVAVSGNYAYLISNDYNGLTILNVTNPSSPVLAGSYDTAGTAYNLAVLGNYVYIADFDNGLVILKTDIQDQDWNPWNDPDSAGGESITLAELQTAIYDWRFGIELPTGQMMNLARLQELIYSWRFGNYVK